jgi:thiol-disulfide isomerase/thioredoxin
MFIRFGCAAFALSALIWGATETVRGTETGSSAPELDVAEWVKGDALTLGAGKGKDVFLIEFWATWCPSSNAMVPCLSALQKKYANDNLVVVAISEEAPETVTDFVKSSGGKIGYRVAVDKDKQSWIAYMEPLKDAGIPHAFLVDKQGKIVWHGHPNDRLDERVAACLKGGNPAFEDEPTSTTVKASASKQ